MRRALVAVAALAALAASAPAGAAQSKFLDKHYADSVHDLRQCLDVLSTSERRIVVLRSGIGPEDPASPRQVATKLGIAVSSVSKAQWVPVRKMRVAQKAGRCDGAKPASTVTATAVKPASTPTAAAVAAPVEKAGWDTPKVLILLGVAAICLMGILREVLGAIRA
jgi:hypothetical protein